MRKHIFILLFVGLSGSVFGQGAVQPRQQQGGATRPAVTPTTPAVTPATTPATTPQTAIAGVPANDNPSIRPTPEGDIMFKRTLWRVINLKEKQNKPMFALNHEISRLIIDAVKSGELPAYKNDSLTKQIAGPEFQSNLNKQATLSAEELASIDQARREHNEMEQLKKRKNKNYVIQPFNEASVSGGIAEYLPSEIDKMELKENVIFDKKRSQLKYDIQAVSLIVKDAASGFDKTLASFAYKDLVKVFKDHPKEAIWYNLQNDAQHKNLADAFDLRLFSSFIRKVSNPADEDLRAIHGGNIQSILASQRAIEELVEFESSLWSQ
jgi:gliding motility associated protien GldN